MAKLNLTDAEKKALCESIAKKMAPTPVKLRAGFELNCFTSEGIDAIKEALLTAKEVVNGKEHAAHTEVTEKDPKSKEESKGEKSEKIETHDKK